jgi:hypothetical protein
MGIKHKFKQEITLSDFLKITEKELINMKINLDNVMKIQKFKKVFVNYLHTKDENDIININDIKKISKKYNITITEYLTAIYIYSLLVKLLKKFV